ncbi:tRNA N(3)-methylcytidine methyltransferase METTL6 [Cylas formicarius]|uniref:tRNA N(3)-methylcytidine methyltransferase METTL6 n=1 Tax=Cylas formicarius TaxID=197179 RepID=UPI002958AA71|nr:tRNA N(3)-methylcytidine methyltransferase METTL6 [Cylas formicarius]
MNDCSDKEGEKLSRILTADDVERLQRQNTRLVNEHKAKMLEVHAKKRWDIFYKRNEARFYKDRHWTTREFQDLVETSDERRNLFEVGCGAGNFIFPLLELGLNFKIFACDLSPRAVEIVKLHSLYNESLIKVFQCDITSEDVFNTLELESLDIITMIFVLSAIHPDKFLRTLKNVFKLLKPGGVLLFRDYGLYDMAQMRFKPGHKISENFYMRQDGTRTYFFSLELVEEKLLSCGFKIVSNSYIHRRTINIKENIDVPRIFVQAKAKRPVQ